MNQRYELQNELYPVEWWLISFFVHSSSLATTIHETSNRMIHSLLPLTTQNVPFCEHGKERIFGINSNSQNSSTIHSVAVWSLKRQRARERQFVSSTLHEGWLNWCEIVTPSTLSGREKRRSLPNVPWRKERWFKNKETLAFQTAGPLRRKCFRKFLLLFGHKR